MSAAAPAESLTSQLSTAAREAWGSATSAVDRLASSVGLGPSSDAPSSPSWRDRFARLPPLERGMAALRWSPLGQSAVVPFPSPPMDDPRMLLALLGLGKVLYDEAAQQQQHHQDAYDNRGGGGGGGGEGWPLPLPPVTCALAAAAVARFVHPALLREVCLSPYCVVERREAGRLWGSALVHLDAPHLASNLAALLPDAAALERTGGSGAFAADVAALMALSSALFVGWGVLEKELLGRSGTYYSVGAVGMSSLAFALQVVRGESQPGARVSLLGLPLPARFAWVGQLAVTHLLAPDSSFAGHVCGVLAGVAHAYVLRPVLRALLGGPPGRAGAPPPAQRPRFYGSGTLSGRPVSGSGGARGGGAGGEAARRWLGGALAQLALAAAAVAVYALAAQRRQRQPLSSWRLR